METKKEKKHREILIVDGTEYKTLLPEGFEKHKKYRMPEKNIVHSFIAGTIRKIHVKEGQKVKKGDKLLILEAMKMNNRVLAPLAGRLRKIYVKEGENVKKDQLLLEIEQIQK